jgi:hypothetical protein
MHYNKTILSLLTNYNLEQPSILDGQTKHIARHIESMYSTWQPLYSQSSILDVTDL